MLQADPVGLAGQELTVSMVFYFITAFVFCNLQTMPLLVGYLLRLSF